MSSKILQRDGFENGCWTFRKKNRYRKHRLRARLAAIDMPLLVIVVALVVFGVGYVVLRFVGFLPQGIR